MKVWTESEINKAMKLHLGIDIGTSGLKTVLLDENMKIAAAKEFPSGTSSASDAAKILLTDSGFSSEHIASCGAIGVGTDSLESSFFGAVPVVLSEFECFSKGAQLLTGEKNALIVSMGTGTSFVFAEGSRYTHIGGSGVGGGTLSGLCRLITGAEYRAEIHKMISKGSETKVDLTMGDIYDGIFEGLAKDVTASNFGKPVMSLDKNDLAAAVSNMIFQTAGVMAALALKGSALNKAVFVGGMTEIPEGRAVLDGVSKLHGTEFIIPENSVFAGAVGAAAKAAEEFYRTNK
ncbi:MAG: BadF/BadG/BcrA/BcrD ATPase family protein [Huintestinicola sp.]